MAIVLYRVDDRLVHGQVVIGWGRSLAADRVILVDDEVAESPWEQDLYQMAAPDGLDVQFANLEVARNELPEWDRQAPRTIVLTGSLDIMAALHRDHPELIRRVNLGGIHHRPGRIERLPYLYLSSAEMEMVRELSSQGTVVSAQDLPTARAVKVVDFE